MHDDVNRLFSPAVPESVVLEQLRGMRFVPLGQGQAARVYGDTEERVALKVFAPLQIGGGELAFISTNVVLRTLERLRKRWEHRWFVRWLKAPAKTVLGYGLSRRDPEGRRYTAECCIEGYRLCIDRGLLDRLPTRILPNWTSQLNISAWPGFRAVLATPPEMVIQKWFRQDAIVGAALATKCRSGASSEECYNLIDRAFHEAMQLWTHGLASIDGRFPVLENQIVLSTGEVQRFDVNNVVASASRVIAFIRAKQMEMKRIAQRLAAGDYPGVLYDTKHASVADAARKLYQGLPHDARDALVAHYLRRAEEILCERTFRGHWEGAPFA